VPLLAASDGGSGSRSITENRNWSGQCLKAEILLGESVVGSGRLISTGRYQGDVTVSGTFENDAPP
jgi:hypothetical protein